MGPPKQRVVEQSTSKFTAYHEAGHALVKYFSTDGSSKLHKVTILPRGRALGMTHFVHDQKREFQYTKQQMLHDIDTLMGGRMAEELTFGENQVSTGSTSDMIRATGIAEDMVKRYGFSRKGDLRVYGSGKIGEKHQDEIDEEIMHILRDSYDRVRELLVSKRKELVALAEALNEYEELSYAEAKVVIEGGKITRPVPSLNSGKTRNPLDRKPNKKSKKKEHSINVSAN